ASRAITPRESRSAASITRPASGEMRAARVAVAPKRHGGHPLMLDAPAADAARNQARPPLRAARGAIVAGCAARRSSPPSVPSSRPLNPTAAVSLEVWARPDAVRHAATLAGKPGQYAIGFTRAGRAVFRLWARGRVHRLATGPGAVRAARTVHLVGTFDGRA